MEDKTKCYYRHIEPIGLSGFVNFHSVCVEPKLVKEFGYHMKFIKILSPSVCMDCTRWEPCED